jgi:hypothetical protein
MILPCYHILKSTCRKRQKNFSVAKTTEFDFNVVGDKEHVCECHTGSTFIYHRLWADDLGPLCITLSRSGGEGKSLKAKMNKARNVFANVSTVWSNDNLSLHTRLQHFSTNIISLQLHGSEPPRRTYKEYRQFNKIQVFVNTCQRRILHSRWPESITKW